MSFVQISETEKTSPLRQVTLDELKGNQRVAYDLAAESIRAQVGKETLNTILLIGLAESGLNPDQIIQTYFGL